MEADENVELVWVHLSGPDCWKDCDYCRQTDFKEFEESPWTWAQEEELELVVYGDFHLSMDPVNIFSGLYTASKMLLRLMKAAQTRKLNEGKEPCGNCRLN